MSENTSLADQAVQALAIVRAMDEGMDMEHPERHAVRSMQRVAEQAMAAGFLTAMDLAWQAKDLRKLAREIEKLRKGEYICRRCGLRKDGEHDSKPDF